MTGKHSARFILPISAVTVGALFFGVQLLRVSEGNVTTATILARNVEFLPTISAMLLTAAPALILPITVYAMVKVRPHITGDLESSIVWILMMVMLVAAIYYSSIVAIALAVGFTVMHRIYLMGKKRGWKKDLSYLRFRFQIAQPMLIGLLVPALLIGPPWLASEVGVIDGEERVIQVLSEDGQTILYMTDSGGVVRANTAEVKQRAFCGPSGGTFIGLISQLSGGRHYERCPSPD